MLAVVQQAAAQFYVSCIKCHALPETQAQAQLSAPGQGQGHGTATYPPMEVVCTNCHDTLMHEQDPSLPPYPPYFLARIGGPDSPLTSACTNCHGAPHVGGILPHPNDVFPYFDGTPPSTPPLLPQSPTSVLPLFDSLGYPWQDGTLGGMVCSTCHDPHIPSYPVGGRSKFLRVGDFENTVPLCGSCHTGYPPAIGSSLFVPSSTNSVHFSVDARGDLEIAVTVRNRGNDFAYNASGFVNWVPEGGYPMPVGPLSFAPVAPDGDAVASVVWLNPPPDFDPEGGHFRIELDPQPLLNPFTPSVFIRGVDLPPAPVNLHPQGVSADSITIAWDLPPGTPPGLAWDVYRDGVKVTPMPTYSTYFIDFGLAPETPHVYRVVSVRLSDGMVSAPSDPIGETTAQGYVVRVPQDFPTIQAAIDAASFATSIHVAPGVYTERLDLTGKVGVTIKGQDANGCILDFSAPSWPVPQIRLGYGGPGNTLSGFTIRNGTIEMDAGDVVTGSVLVRNEAPDQPLIIGSGLVAQCTLDSTYRMVLLMPDGFLTAVNSIFLGPAPVDQYALPERILLLNNDFPFWPGWQAYDGSGNFAAMPMFAAPGPPQSYLPDGGSPTCGAGLPFLASGVGAFECGMMYTPQPPANLVATVVPAPSRHVDLNWTPSIGQVMNYYVYRATDPGFPGDAGTQPYAVVPGGVNSWEDYAVTAGPTYYYRVRASGGLAPPPLYELLSAPTNTVSARDASGVPLALDDAATMAEGGVAVIPVLANDSDPDGDAFHIVDVGFPANGLARMLPDETIEYTPLPDFFGTDSFTYTVLDAGGASATATVTVTVTPVNDPPYAVYDTYFVDEDTPISRISGVMLTNDWDLEANYPLTLTVASPPSHGTLVQDFADAFSYRPAPDFHGTDSFTYTVTDSLGAVSAPGTVTITVRPVNDAPVADAQAATVAEDGSVAVTLTGSDVDGDVLTYAVAQQPEHGMLSGAAPNLTYAPAANYNGPDSFTFTVSDGQLTSSEATVTITVTPVNDPPAAVDDAYATAEDTALVVSAPGLLGNDSDIDGDALSAVLVAGPAHGTLALDASGAFVYTPAANYNGPDSFTYQASDGQASSAAATVSIQVSAVNDAPVADVSPDEQTFRTNATITFSGAPSSDVDGTIVSYSWDFGDGTTATGMTVTKRYKKVGVYTVTLTVTDDLGATGTDSGTAIAAK